MTLTFLWFEWPPAQALEELGKEYTKTRPNVTVKVNTVPNAQWHDAIFTQFAAQKTNFDMPILDSQNIGEAVTNGSILDITDFVKKNIDTSQYDPYFLAAYGQYPQAQTGEANPDAKTYGLPLLGDTWTMIWRKDLMGDKPPATWDDMIAAAKKCQEKNPGMSGLAFHQAGTATPPRSPTTSSTRSTAASCGTRTIARSRASSTTPPARRRWTCSSTRWSRSRRRARATGSSTRSTPRSARARSASGSSGSPRWAACSIPKSSKLGKTKEEILKKLAFAPLPKQDTDKVPLGGMGLHVSRYIPKDKQAEALNFIKWFQTPEAQKKWAQLGGVPARNDVLESPEFLDAAAVQQGVHGVRAAR